MLDIAKKLIFAICLSRPGASAFIKLASVVFLLVIGGYAALAAVYHLPEASLRDHILQAYKEGYFAENFPRRSPDMVTGKRYDMWTECSGIGAALGKTGSLTDLLKMNNYGNCTGLSEAAAQGLNKAPDIQYMRYIHGYELVLKPLYTFFSMRAARVIIASLTVSLLLALFFVLKRHVGQPQAAVVTLSFLLPCSPNVFIMSVHAVQFWLVLSGSILAVYAYKKIPPLLLFGLLGAADAFVSSLNMGSLSLGLPLLCHTLKARAEGETLENIVAGSFWGCIGWSIGFVLPWLLKWGALTLIVQPRFDELFASTIDEYAARSIGMILLALFKNFAVTHWEVWLPLFAVLLIRRKLLRLKAPETMWAVLLPALIPVVWVCCLPGQSGIKHSTFTNMIFWPTFAAAALLLMPMAREADFFKELLRKPWAADKQPAAGQPVQQNSNE